MSQANKRKIRDSLDEVSKGGAFERKESQYREIVSNEHAEFKPESGRYHLFVSLACPWANRCVAIRALKQLENHIGLTVVHPTWKKTKENDDEDAHAGWWFYDSKTDAPFKSRNGHGSFHFDGLTPCPFADKQGNKIKSIRDLYDSQDDTSGKFTVPVLWDTKNHCIVNNESSEIILMLNSQFADAFGSGPYKDLDLYPAHLREEIDGLNDWIYPGINNGVYRCGFAKTQEAYEDAFETLFSALDRLEKHLATRRFLCEGGQITTADIRLFMTLARFDEVYVVYFKTNKKFLVQYPNIRQYMRDMYSVCDGRIGKTIDMDHIKTHYFTSHPQLNTYAIIPIGTGALEDMQMAPEGRANLP